MTQKYQTIDELIREEEDAALERTRREIAAEKAAWDALTTEQQVAIIAKREAEYDALFANVDDSEEDEEDDEDEDDE